MLQGFSSSLFSWNHNENRFRINNGVYVTHLSLKSLHSLLNQFLHAATCLQIVEITVKKVETAVPRPNPTFNAFVASASSWLKV